MSVKRGWLGKSVAIGAIVGSVIALLAFFGVDPSRWWRHEPLPVSLLGVTAESTETIEQEFAVSETNTRHETIGTNKQSYSKRFRSREGYRIDDHKWNASSATRVSDLNIHLDEGGASIVMDFKLKSGPKTDRYRGWLRGNLWTKQVRTIPRTEEMLAHRIDVSRPRSALPNRNYDQYEELRVLDGNGNLLATLTTKSPSAATSIGRSLRLTKYQDQFVLESRKL